MGSMHGRVPHPVVVRGVQLAELRRRALRQPNTSPVRNARNPMSPNPWPTKHKHKSKEPDRHLGDSTGHPENQTGTFWGYGSSKKPDRHLLESGTQKADRHRLDSTGCPSREADRHLLELGRHPSGSGRAVGDTDHAGPSAAAKNDQCGQRRSRFRRSVSF